MQRRFTQNAIKVLKLAQYEARHLKHNYVGTEHLLLGLLHEGNSIAAKALSSLGIDLYSLRQRVHDIAPSQDYDDYYIHEIATRRMRKRRWNLPLKKRRFYRTTISALNTSCSASSVIKRISPHRY